MTYSTKIDLTQMFPELLFIPTMSEKITIDLTPNKEYFDISNIIIHNSLSISFNKNIYDLEIKDLKLHIAYFDIPINKNIPADINKVNEFKQKLSNLKYNLNNLDPSINDDHVLNIKQNDNKINTIHIIGYTTLAKIINKAIDYYINKPNFIQYELEKCPFNFNSPYLCEIKTTNRNLLSFVQKGDNFYLIKCYNVKICKKNNIQRIQLLCDYYDDKFFNRQTFVPILLYEILSLLIYEYCKLPNSKNKFDKVKLKELFNNCVSKSECIWNQFYSMLLNYKEINI